MLLGVLALIAGTWVLPVEQADDMTTLDLEIEPGSMSTQKMMEMQRLVADWEKLTGLYGTKVLSNHGGVVFVPSEEKDTACYVVDRHGNSYGQLRIDLSLESHSRAASQPTTDLERDSGPSWRPRVSGGADSARGMARR